MNLSFKPIVIMNYKIRNDKENNTNKKIQHLITEYNRKSKISIVNYANLFYEKKFFFDITKNNFKQYNLTKNFVEFNENIKKFSIFNNNEYYNNPFAVISTFEEQKDFDKIININNTLKKNLFFMESLLNFILCKNNDEKDLKKNNERFNFKIIVTNFSEAKKEQLKKILFKIFDKITVTIISQLYSKIDDIEKKLSSTKTMYQILSVFTTKTKENLVNKNKDIIVFRYLGDLNLLLGKIVKAAEYFMLFLDKILGSNDPQLHEFLAKCYEIIGITYFLNNQSDKKIYNYLCAAKWQYSQRKNIIDSMRLVLSVVNIIELRPILILKFDKIINFETDNQILFSSILFYKKYCIYSLLKIKKRKFVRKAVFNLILCGFLLRKIKYNDLSISTFKKTDELYTYIMWGNINYFICINFMKLFHRDEITCKILETLNNFKLNFNKEKKILQELNKKNSIIQMDHENQFIKMDPDSINIFLVTKDNQSNNIITFLGDKCMYSSCVKKIVISARFTNNMNSIIMLNNFEIFYEYKNKMNSTKSNETLKIKSSKSKYVKLKSNKTYFLRKKLYSQI